MWVRLTFAKIKPDSVDELSKIYNEELLPKIKAQKGCIDAMLLEPVSEEEDFISCTLWESKENGDAYENSGTYKEMVGKVANTFSGLPTLKSYEVKK